MTAAQSVQARQTPLCRRHTFDRFCCVLGTTGEKTAAAAEHRADRISVEGYQRQQQLFHRLIVEVKVALLNKPRISCAMACRSRA
jgi:hypothetical protein